MKNIKVNYTNEQGKRTSTTLNYNICWQYFITTDIFKSDVSMCFKDSAMPFLITEIQNFVNSIKFDYISKSKGINKQVFEELLMHSIVTYNFDKGVSAAASNQEQPF